MDNSYTWNGTACKKGYKLNKTLKRCVSNKSVPLPKLKTPTPTPPLPKLSPRPPPAPKPLPLLASKPPKGVQQLIQIPKRHKECPPRFEYNKTTKMCEKCPQGTRKVGRTCVLLPTDDDEEVDDEPVVVLPKPAPLYGESLNDLLHRLEDAGKQVQDPTFIRGRYMIFIYIYLMKKYASLCSLFNEESYSIRYDATAKTLEYSENLATEMQDCVLRGADLIFITLLMTDTGVGSHVNILIYRPFKKVVERYEPHGEETSIDSEVYSEYDLNKQLKQLFEQTIQPVMQEYTPVFKTPFEICPRTGFQLIEGLLPENEKEQGYCQMWNMFMMETILLNPTLNTKDIIEKCIEIGKDEPEYFKNVVRGYTQQIAREIKEYLSKVTQDIGSEEAAREFYDLDLKDLVDEILEETKKRSKPLPEVGETPATLSFSDIEEIETEVEKLTESEVEVYIQFIKDGIITKSYSENLPQSKQILMKLMLSRVLNWDTLMDNIYNSYFTQLFNNRAKQIKYFLRYEHYDNVPDGILNSLPNLSMEEKMELLEQVQAVYPFFHTFKENFDSEIEDIPEFTDEDREEVETDITKLSQKEVADYLYRIENKGQPSEEDLDDFMSMTTHEEREYYLTIHLQENNTYVASIQNMLKM
jgi:hypothetical protein